MRPIRSIALVLLALLLPLLAAAYPNNRCPVPPPKTLPQRNAALYVPFDKPGCYANGSTALAANGAPLSFSRASVAYLPDTNKMGRWRSCAANELRVGGWGVGAWIDQPATNLLLTPTDSPTDSGNWAPIAVGPTVIANSNPYIDGTNTSTGFVESAGVVSGLQQSITVAAQRYCGSIDLNYSNRQCWGISLDGTTVDAKFDILGGSVTYKDANAVAAIRSLPRGWYRVSACRTLAAATTPVQFFATSTCTDNAKAATGATLQTYLARAQFESASGANWRQATTYTPTGTARPTEAISFPLALGSNINVCIGVKIEPTMMDWDARETNVVGAYRTANGTTFGSANSMSIQMGSNGAVFGYVYGGDGVQKASWATMHTDWASRPHVLKLCTNSAGEVKLGIDGNISTFYNGAGTGILSAPPDVIYPGALSGSGAFNVSHSLAMSDLIACPIGDPNKCGDWRVQAKTAFGALGDSITSGEAVGVTMAWTGAAELALPKGTVANMSKSGWSVMAARGGWDANRMHRYRAVAVAAGTNDSTAGGSMVVFDRLRSIYDSIAATGAIPIPMTILPRNLAATPERYRKEINVAMKEYAQVKGWPVADVATFMDAGTYGGTPGTLRSIWDSGDGLHPNQTGSTEEGRFMAQFFRDNCDPVSP